VILLLGMKFGNVRSIYYPVNFRIQVKDARKNKFSFILCVLFIVHFPQHEFISAVKTTIFKPGVQVLF